MLKRFAGDLMTRRLAAFFFQTDLFQSLVDRHFSYLNFGRDQRRLPCSGWASPAIHL